jgi:Disulphide bond corrector protein DsbC
VRAKFFEDNFVERFTPAGILVRQFGTSGAHLTEIKAPHVKLTAGASDAKVWPGNRIILTLHLDIEPGMHVYAPGVGGGYIPIAWTMPESKTWLALPVTYPESHMLNFDVIQETVPVYTGHLRLTRDLTLSRAIHPGELKVEGIFQYQACDDRQCYAPQSVPINWSFEVEPLDRQRAPAALQHKPGKSG